MGRDSGAGARRFRRRAPRSAHDPLPGTAWLSRATKTRWAVPNSVPGEQPQHELDRLQDEVAALRRSRRRLAEVGDADRRGDRARPPRRRPAAPRRIAVNLQRLAGLIDPIRVAAHGADRRDGGRTSGRRWTRRRRWREQIYPPLARSRGLASALRSAAERRGHHRRGRRSGGRQLPAGDHAAVYWTCVETLSSASRGSQATVSVHETDGALTFEIAIAGRLAERAHRPPARSHRGARWPSQRRRPDRRRLTRSGLAAALALRPDRSRPGTGSPP